MTEPTEKVSRCPNNSKGHELQASPSGEKMFTSTGYAAGADKRRPTLLKRLDNWINLEAMPYTLGAILWMPVGIGYWMISSGYSDQGAMRFWAMFISITMTGVVGYKMKHG